MLTSKPTLLTNAVNTIALKFSSHNDDEQFIYKINSGGINEDIAGYWVEIAVIASKPYTGHRHTLIKYVSIHK